MMSKSKAKDSKDSRDSGEDRSFEEVSIGDQVKHPQWGVGTVLFRSGVGDLSKAIVVFPEEGQKKLMLKYAKLKKVGSAPKSEIAKIRAQETEKQAHVEEEEIEPVGILPDGDEEVPLPEGEEVDVFEDDDESFVDHEEAGDEI